MYSVFYCFSPRIHAFLAQIGVYLNGCTLTMINAQLSPRCALILGWRWAWMRIMQSWLSFQPLMRLMKRQKLQKVCTFMGVRCHLVYSAFALIFAHIHAILTLFAQ